MMKRLEDFSGLRVVVLGTSRGDMASLMVEVRVEAMHLARVERSPTACAAPYSP